MSKTTYYNEIDSFACSWLKNLMVKDQISHGVIDERSICEVGSTDLELYSRCHFFAGIGGWDYALKLAGWPEDREVWTGSCPCQPFSIAGKGEGKRDERHLAPHWLKLIKECRPATIFGEQVASAIAHGWLDDLFNELEKEGYAVGSAVLPACSVGAPHKRDRLWFMAHLSGTGLEGDAGEGIQGDGIGRSECGESSIVAHTDCKTRWEKTRNLRQKQQRDYNDSSSHEQDCSFSEIPEFWRDSEYLLCRDGKWRPVEPGTFPLAYGVSNRLGKLRGYGNAIAPQVASVFIKSFMEVV